jgi:hypothetical protein
VEIPQTGIVKDNFDFIWLPNYQQAADMDGTLTSILWKQNYYDTTPALVDSGRISVGTETDWTSTASTQDSYMAFSTTLDGAIAEKVRITSGGNVGIATTTPSAKLHVVSTDTSTLQMVNTQASGSSAGAGILAYSNDGAAMASGDRLGFYLFGGTYDASSHYYNTASVEGFASEAFSSGHGGSRLVFKTCPVASSTRAEVWRMSDVGSLSNTGADGTAYVHLKAGTAAASTAPLKFSAGTSLTTPEAGAIEWDGVNLYATQTAGPTRQTIAYTTSTVARATASDNSAITNDTTTNATMYPTWVTANTGDLPIKVSSTKLTFNPSTGTLTTTTFAGNASTATALAADPSACAATKYVTDMAANGTLTCTQPSMTDLQAFTSANFASVCSDESGTGYVAMTDSPVFTTQITTPKIKAPAASLAILPTTDGTTAIQLQDKDGNYIVNVDTTNNRVGINTNAPVAMVHVNNSNDGTGSDATYHGYILISETDDQVLTSTHGIEFKASTWLSGYGFRLSGSDVAGGGGAFVLESRANSATWTERFRLNASTGFLGIGQTAPSTLTEWLTPDNVTTLTVKVNETQANANGVILDIRSTTGSEGNINLAAGGVVTYNAFTGSHFSQVKDKFGLEPYMVVCSTGEALDEWPEIEDREGRTIPIDKERNKKVTYKASAKPQLTKTKVCDKRKDKSVYGVYAYTDNEGRDNIWALGTGYCLVTNKGRDIEVGDYLTSSDIRGLMELQDDDLLHNYTVAKSTQNIKWKPGETRTQIRCTYHGG